ncbi:MULTISPECIES: carboxymuconolactone decarboxylase family protein [Lactobacillaceae]|uniref:carboxymuconolactone decarboxylase family protein n=1 Tax=Lactobacillaceae TaxID=33958 RepID=UPI0014576ACA|nr:carboxymuconolactone decarboxylase family protein [Lactobacillus sp. HBUAS51381]NLR10423.1 carboxymuconolactone decarboxylase family protein [Lactobacillus sp. HBUAS51381]
MTTENEQLVRDWLPDDPDLVAIVNRLMTAVTTAPEAVEPGEVSVIALITLTVQHAPRMIPQQVERALQNGVSARQLLETVYQLVPVVGLPKVQVALSAMHPYLPTPAKAEPMATADAGAAVQQQLYGTEIKTLLKDLPANAGNDLPQWLTQHFFEDYYGRDGLTVAQRERYELMALITLNVDFQIKAHARGSLKAGNSEERLIWSALQLLPYVGFPLVINSVQQIHAAAVTLRSQKEA